MPTVAAIPDIADRGRTVTVSPLERMLIDRFQQDIPLSPRPYLEIALALGVSEAEVLAALGRLLDAGILSRVGAVVRPNCAGRSTLAAMAVPSDRLEAVSALVSAYPEVNHNYERDHRINLWFVAAAPDETQLQAVLAEIEARTGITVLDLPLLEAFHIDLGFPVQWH